MKVKNVMTAKSVKFCTKDANLQEVAKKMKVNNCGALPVVDEDNKVVGIITDRDICLSISKKSIIPPGDRKVKDAMTKKIVTVHGSDEISVAYQQMRKNKVGRLPVVDAKGRLEGIVSLHKLINEAVRRGKNELGEASASGENLIKTIQAVTNRYNKKELKKKSKLLSTI
jgi:CBS domain-containing protein